MPRKSKEKKTPRIPFTVAPTDYGALTALYRSTQGDRWANKGGWGTSDELGTWFGVDVNEHGRVVALNLRRNNLRGTIPAELGRLKALEELDLSQNELGGSIPPTLANLGELQVLNLEANQLSGVVSPELGDLSALTYLELGGNYLQGVLPTVDESISSWRERLVKPQPVFTPPPQPEVPPPMASPDRDALVSLFHTTGGANWTRKGNWCTSAELPTWDGVKVNQQGRVVELDLSDNNLQGPIPKALGALSELKKLAVHDNKLTGSIPAEIGALGKLERVYLYGNQLSGSIPGELADLGKMQVLRLNGNKLTGPIPEAFGALSELKKLAVHDNELTGSIPGELGALKKLEMLYLYGNQLSGPIPEAFGALSELRKLAIHDNKLTGSIPVQLGALGKMEHLWLKGNQLTGSIPGELAGLGKMQVLRLDGNKLTGGPAKGESLGSWRARLRQEEQAAVREDPQPENPAARTSPSTQGDKPGKLDGATTEPTSDSSQEIDRHHTTQVQISSFSALNALSGVSQASLEQVRQLVKALGANRSSPGTGLGETGTLRELDRLVAMAKDLGDLVSRHVTNEDIQRRELALLPGPKAYYTTVRTGVCNAYLAASVVCSRLVCTSKTGRMGTAGKTLKFLSSAVPVVSGLAGLAASALKAGDRYLQTRRVSKICDIAPDSADCCVLARKLALQLSERCVDDIPTTDTAEESGMHTTAGVGDVEGGSGWSQDFGASPDASTEEAVMDWFVEEVADYEPNNCDARKTTPAVQAGRKLGKRHLHTLLKTVGRDCLRGANSPEEKVKVLVGIIFPESEGKDGSTSGGTQERINHDDGSAQPDSRQSHPAVTHPADLDGAAKSDNDVAALMERMASMRILMDATHKEVKANLEDSRAKTAELEASLEASRAKQDELEAGLEAANEENATLKEGLTSMRILMEATQEEVKARLDCSKAKTTALEAAFEGARATQVELETGLEAANAENATIKDDLTSVRIHIEATQDEVKANLEDSSAKTAKLEAGLQAANEENATLKDGLEAANAINARLESEVKILNKMVMKPGPDADSLVPSGGGQALKQRQSVTETVDGFFERAQKRAPTHNGLVTQGQLAEALELLKEVHSEYDELHREHDATLRRIQRAVDTITRRLAAVGDDMMPQDELREFLALHDELLRERGADNR